MKIQELKFTDITKEFGDLKSFVNFCNIGTRNMADMVLLKDYIVNSINTELTNYNFFEARTEYEGIFISTECFVGFFAITLKKEDVPESTHNIFVNHRNLEGYICDLLDRHNQTSKKMNLFLPIFRDHLTVNDDGSLKVIINCRISK